MQNHTLQVADIYIPTARRKTLDPAKTEEIAESMIEEGQITPIQVRKDGERFVLIEGLHRLEACKLLGEETIIALLVQARRR
jgi:ParB-like chromosome segregation protein Spo0J